MNDIQLHPNVQKQLKAATINQPSSLIFHGVAGVGLYTIANAFAHSVTTDHNIATMRPDEKGTIKINDVRQLYRQTRARRVQKMVIIIDDADAMQATAQNALLKLFEETPQGIIFVLTSHNPQLLLPTIRSRGQEVIITPLSNAQSLQLLGDLSIKDQQKQTQLLYLANGLPAEIIRLTEDDEYYKKRAEEIRLARDFLSARVYEKLVISQAVASDRNKALQLLQDAMRIVEISLKKQPETTLAVMLENLLHTQQKLLSDGHVRTQLLNLAVKA